MGIRVLLTENDEELRDGLSRHLTATGMEVRSFATEPVLGQELQRHPIDIAVCGLGLSVRNGFSFAARLRTASRAGIIVLAVEPRQEDRILGLSVGVDHYLAKPIDLRELELVIRNLFRRLSDAAPNGLPTHKPEHGRWLLDLVRWTLSPPSGGAIALSAAEYHFLSCLLLLPGQIVDRDSILAALSRPNLKIYSRNLDVTISRLRRKVEQKCGETLPVLSARGSGYVFTGRASLVN